MPELPEVEVVARDLSRVLKNKIVDDVVFFRKDLRFPFPVNDLRRILKGQKIISVKRRFKYILIETPIGFIRVNLGMSGSFTCFSNNLKKIQVSNHHLSLILNDGNTLGYIDPRRFGFWSVYEPLEDLSVIDPLSEIELEAFFNSDKFKKCNRRIWDVLIDQKLIGGIGNIYALEALYLSRIHPAKQCSKIKSIKLKILSKVIPEMLNFSIKQGGSSIQSYKNINGEKGKYQDSHLVYGKDGLLCNNCKAKIKREKLGSRSVYFCPKCQKRG